MKNKQEIEKILNTYGWEVLQEKPLMIRRKGDANSTAKGEAAMLVYEYFAAIDDVATNKLPKWKKGTEERMREDLLKKAVFKEYEINSIVNYLWRKDDRGFNKDIEPLIVKFEMFRPYLDDRDFGSKERMRYALSRMVFDVNIYR